MKCPHCQNENPEGTRFCGRCGRELPASGDTTASGTVTLQTPSKGLQRGTTFARRFEIIEAIGQGGMGTVYKAYDSKIREVVALKLLKPEIASDLEVIERFRNEIKLARQVSHRHVCRMYDLGEEWLSIYISMEYVPGEDLKSFIRRSGHLNEAKAVGLAKQIAEGLAEAHRIGVVHRDLKPQNIMIDRDGNAKIMDFGIARSLHTRGATGTGVIIGTPEYMAPEQAEGRDIDHRVDIYALGAILFEMVTGRVPFEGETPLSIVLKHRSEPPADPHDINAQISAGLSRIVLKCLAKKREDRYASAADVLEDLSAVERALPVTGQATVRARPVTDREITVKFRLKKMLWPGLPLFLAFAAAVFVIIQLADRADTGRALSRVRPTAEASRRGAEIPPPSPPAEPTITGLAGGSSQSAILSFLTPLIKDSSKFLSEKDAREIESALTDLKAKYPKEAAAFSRYIDSIQDRIRQANKEREAGNIEASRRSYDRGESEMRKLLAQVNERDRAEQAFQELQEMKGKMAGASRTGRPNLLTWIALEKEKDASDAFAGNDFSGARILCGILIRVHRLSPKAVDEQRGLEALRELTAEIRGAAEAALAPSKQAWLYERAVTEQESAARMAGEGLVPRAAEQYILAAFLFEKAKEVSLESAQAGRS
ncbi:MAG TPA: serine/threonine protein kinase [Candidatus Aminicenantes bacterium]|nr:protein kinase [Candidatus Aminicenantes bacterium]HDT14463.1 serine/threonine protein kinase [Candidatus Aminicenantes bacterium]